MNPSTLEDDMTEGNGKDIETPTEPQKPQDDLLLLGQLTPDEFAEIQSLSHQRVSQERQIARLEIQKYKLMMNVSGTERALQQSMDRIGNRLNVPRDVKWDVWPDQEGNGHARAFTPEMLAQMMMGQAPPKE